MIAECRKYDIAVWPARSEPRNRFLVCLKQTQVMIKFPIHKQARQVMACMKPACEHMHRSPMHVHQYTCWREYLSNSDTKMQSYVIHFNGFNRAPLNMYFNWHLSSCPFTKTNTSDCQILPAWNFMFCEVSSDCSAGLAHHKRWKRRFGSSLGTWCLESSMCTW